MTGNPYRNWTPVTDEHEADLLRRQGGLAVLASMVEGVSR
jgi:hypothetical protein